MKSVLPTIAVALGLVLVVVSLLWGVLFPAGSGWTEEKSLRMRELSERAHVLGGQLQAAKAKPDMKKGLNPAEMEAEYKQVTTELAQLGEEAEGKIQAPKTAASILRWAGVAFVLAGGMVIYAGKG